MYARSERLVELFRQEVSLLLREVKDPGLAGFLTVTGLELSKDMKTAVVFYSLLGTPEERRSSALALERCAGFIRHALRERLNLKLIPQLTFHYDDTPEKASKVERIFLQIGKEKKAEALPDSPAQSLSRPRPSKDR